MQYPVFCLKLHTSFVNAEYWLEMAKRLVKKRNSLIQGAGEKSIVENKSEKRFLIF